MYPLEMPALCPAAAFDPHPTRPYVLVGLRSY